MEYVAAIDQGTTGTRVIVFDGAGRRAGNAYATHEQHYPQPGWVEHDPEEILSNVHALVPEALSDAGIDAGDLAALGITNQRETVVVWEADTGRPVDRAIVWQDRRTVDRLERLDDDVVEYVRSTTGLQTDAYFSAAKFEALLDEDDRRARARGGDLLAGTVDAWLLWNLTGEHATDVTNASRTMLFDLDALAYDDRLCETFSVPRACLPTVRPSGADFGTTDLDGTLAAAVPVRAALGDQHAALVGQSCFGPGATKATHGTGSFVLMNTGPERRRSDHGLLETVAYQLPGEEPRYALEGSVFTTGAAVEWLADVGLVDDVADVEGLASGVDSPDGVYLVPAFQGLGAPHWDGRARGTLVGLTRGTRREHVARATLEAVAYQIRDVLEAMSADSGLAPERLRVDGGAAENDLLCGFQADALGATVVRPAETETTALGAALVAGLAVGTWESEAELRGLHRADREFEASDPGVARRYDRWGDAVERAKGWVRESE